MDEERVELVVDREAALRDIKHKMKVVFEKIEALMKLKDGLNPDVVDGFLEELRADLKPIDKLFKDILKSNKNYIKKNKKSIPYYSDDVYNDYVRAARYPCVECK